MPVVEVRFTKLEANREKPDKPVEPGNLKISNNSKVVDIKKEKAPGLGEVVIVNFEYETKYEPNIGSIVIGGSLLFHDKKLKDHLKIEKGEIMLKSDAYLEVQNAILGSSTVQALLLAKELRLPPPIQMPSVSKAEPESKGKKGYA